MDDCTLIIVSHERKELLVKSFNYHKKYFKKILILDSSKSNNKLLFDSDYEYFHLFNFSLAEKIYHGLKKIKTTYVLIVPDDDFILPKIVKKGINFLDKNNDYVSYGGKYISFNTIYNLFKFHILYKDLYFTNNSSNPLARLNSLIKKHPQMTYYLYRKEILFNIFKIFKSFSYANFPEIIISLVPTLYGKHKHTNSVWMLRDGTVYTNYKIGMSKVIKKKYSIYYIDSNFYKKKIFSKFRHLYLTLAKKNKINILYTSKLVKKYFVEQHESKKIRTNILSYLKSKIKKIAGKNNYSIIKYIYYFSINSIFQYKFNDYEKKQIKIIKHLYNFKN